jgi:hypothetical protein
MNLMDALYVAGYVFLIALMYELMTATKWIEHDLDTEDVDDVHRAKKLDVRFGIVGTALFLLVNLYLIFVTFK